MVRKQMKEYSTRNYTFASVKGRSTTQKGGNRYKNVRIEKEAAHPTQIRREYTNEKNQTRMRGRSEEKPASPI